MAIQTNFIKHKWKKVKLTFILRMLLVCIVIFVFYLRFLLISKSQTEVYKLNENSMFSSPMKRKILAVNLVEHSDNTSCSKPAILEFPSDGFTREERHNGWIIAHIVVMFYGFWFLAAICDDYLMPCIEQICLSFKIDRDVVGATVMAAAVSSPELFMNCVGTFITKGDIGVGTVVGSAVFNLLAVPACCGLFVTNYLKLDWWPITRDCLVYLIAVLSLVGILQDGKVMWYEALGLIIAYFIYMLVMYHNHKIANKAKKLLRRCGFQSTNYSEVSEFTSLLSRNINESRYSLASEAYQNLEQGLQSSHMMLYLEYQEISALTALIASPWSVRDHLLVEFILRWPITLILWLTIPNTRKRPIMKYVSLIMSIIWIALISYLVVFVITIIGDTLHIPDAVMGLTILAAGTSIPETVASIIVTKQGQGSMGISNSLGSNTFNILLSLGVPWFIKSYFLPDVADQRWLTLNSDSLTYASVLLLTSLLGLYVAFAYNKFILNWQLGMACGIMYIIFMVLATLVELNVFFMVNLPLCPH